MALNKTEQESVKAQILNTLAEMVTLPLPQQAMVIGHMIGLFAGAAMKDKGMTQLQATCWALDQMSRKIADVKPH